MAAEKIYTILELNNRVRDLIKEGFPQAIWVCGEIQGLRPERNKKHIYFELVQKEEQSDQITAKVKVALFFGKQAFIQQRLKQAEDAFELKNDIEVKLLCEVSLHPPTGQYSLVIIDIDPIYTLGKVAQNRLKIIEELKKEGLLERNKLVPLSIVPLRIGLITAYDSAAYHDFINEIATSGYGFKILTFNCHMQGKAVEKDVVKALDFFNKMSQNDLEAVVITRGGGSTADLSWFDSKKIAEKIAVMDFSVITALGHQIDFTISDMVAHTSCKTPTKAAQFLVERVRDFLENIKELEKQILSAGESFVSIQKQNLQNLTVKVENVSTSYFRLHREDLIDKKHQILSILKVFLTESREDIKRKTTVLNTAIDKIFQYSKDNLKYAEEKVKILNPKNILKRGYSITFKADSPVKSIDELKEHDIIKTILYKGKIVSEVQKKEREDGKKTDDL
ncbi:MAG: exodeoxyribonuclease VII large subunit [Candidatus Omnitrophica bacterium]|jgi:exodeoxyribonuclease VII large subunit|nr:exodeoxyribonuclease VII large subunit [Candidatus Omnitrophota bacterium]